MRYIADRGGLNYVKRPWTRAQASNNGATYTTFLNITGSGWLYYLSGEWNSSDGRVIITVDGVVSDAIQFSRNRDTSGGYARLSGGIYNIPIRFESSLLIQAIYNTCNMIYALD